MSSGAVRDDVVIQQDEPGCWSVYRWGRKVVDRESFAVANQIAECLADPSAHPGTEAAEVAGAIRGADSTQEGT